jgi:hypothetical protein
MCLCVFKHTGIKNIKFFRCRKRSLALETSLALASKLASVGSYVFLNKNVFRE